MIVIENKQLLILTPPHAGSGFLHKFYCARGAYYAIGPNPDGNIDHHYMSAHNAWKKYKKILVVRHPFERLVGLYDHHRWYSEKNGYPLITWDQYVHAVVSNNPDIPWFYKWTIQDILNYYGITPDEIWKYEELKTPPYELEVPPVEYPQKDYSIYEHLRPVVNIWGQKDLEYYA